MATVTGIRSQIREFVQNQEDVSIVALTDALLALAIESRASDLHIDPWEGSLKMRMRVDGMLLAYEDLPYIRRDELIARLKVLAGLRTDEHAKAQDGRFRFSITTGSHYDIRISIIPTYYGENAVLRFLYSSEERLELNSLGLSKCQEHEIRSQISKTSGLVLVTGPTGSGKTTTLYTLMRLLQSRPLSLVTIEDPVEYALTGVRQIQADDLYGLSISRGLRSILRQDPDVIMVGEIRDSETAHLAAHAALTGHLVLATLHTVDTASALVRLRDLGIEPYLVTSTVSMVIGQRLMRRLCKSCVTTNTLSGTERIQLESMLEVELPDDLPGLQGCHTCELTGYKGRVGAFEVLRIGSVLREAFLHNANAHELQLVARAEGLVPMSEDATSKMLAGITTPEEVLRIRYG